MPWTPKQHNLFQAAAHNPAIAKSSGIAQADAARMAAEGIKSSSAQETKKKTLVKALRGG
jgi:hypothetical protein